MAIFDVDYHQNYARQLTLFDGRCDSACDSGYFHLVISPLLEIA